MGITLSTHQQEKERARLRPKTSKIIPTKEFSGDIKTTWNRNNRSFNTISSKNQGQEDPSESLPVRKNGINKNTSAFESSNVTMQQPFQNQEDGGNSSYVADDEVKVNLAMADLMAFLLVVANNSNNLPLTRRDDPEIGKTVSTLTADEYARKSAAFLPADVRVIGGSFTKYGRVWDLPTSQEYNASDGAQEPGMFQ